MKDSLCKYKILVAVTSLALASCSPSSSDTELIVDNNGTGSSPGEDLSDTNLEKQKKVVLSLYNRVHQSYGPGRHEWAEQNFKDRVVYNAKKLESNMQKGSTILIPFSAKSTGNPVIVFWSKEDSGLGTACFMLNRDEIALSLTEQEYEAFHAVYFAKRGE